MSGISSLWSWFSGLFRGAKQSAPTSELAEAVALGSIPEPESAATADETSEFSPQLTVNFHIDEFNCTDGTPVPEKFISTIQKLARNLQVLRDELNKPIQILSGYRTPEYNKKIGGAKQSQHMFAAAADIKVKGVGPQKLAEIITKLIEDGKMDKGGVGIYPTFTHYDVRGKNARWGGSRKSN